MMRRRRTALAKSPTEIAIEVLLKADKKDRYRLFTIVLEDIWRKSGISNEFYGEFYELADRELEDVVLDIMYDEADEPTKFGLAVANEASLFIDGILEDALAYDREELTKRL